MIQKLHSIIITLYKKNYFATTEILTIDLIPVLPVKGRNLNEMNNLITKTLSTEKPPNWLKYLKGFMKKDRVLPESFVEQFRRSPVLEVGMKLLHFGSKRNFIIRPAQQLSVAHELRNRKLKSIYCQIKCLKSLLGIDVNSYFIKKVLLTNEMKEKIEEGTFYNVLQHPDLRAEFEKAIDYANWKPKKDIPILEGIVGNSSVPIRKNWH